MKSKKMMTAFSVAVLFAQMGFADVSQEMTAEEVVTMHEQMQELAATAEEADATLLVKKDVTKETKETFVEKETATQEVKN